jgi:hypothetical protein
MAFLVKLRRCTLSFESLTVINAPGLLASLMDIHHDTSLKSILKDNSISSAFKAHIHSCLSKGARLWLVVRPFIYSFHIAHFTFTLALHFHLGLIQLSTSSLFMYECGHGLDASNTHLAHYPFGGQQICPRLIKRARYMEKVVVHPYVKIFIMNQSLHDLKGLSFHCQCGGYQPNVGNNGFECH